MENKKRVIETEINKPPSIVTGVFFLILGIAGFVYDAILLLPQLDTYPEMEPGVYWTWVMCFNVAFFLIYMMALILMGIDVFMMKKRNRGFTTFKLLQTIALTSGIISVVSLVWVPLTFNILMLVSRIPGVIFVIVYSAVNPAHIKEYKGKITLAAVEAAAVAVIIPMLVFTYISLSHCVRLVYSNVSINEAASFTEFSAECFDGSTLTQDYFKDHTVTMINCWETTCHPCVEELPYLQKEYEEKYGDDFAIIGICSDLYQGGQVNDKILDDARTIISQSGVEYPVLIPTAELMNGVVNNITAFPTTFFVDSEGNLIDMKMGGNTKEGWDECIEQMINKVKNGN